MIHCNQSKNIQTLLANTTFSYFTPAFDSTAKMWMKMFKFVTEGGIPGILLGMFAILAATEILCFGTYLLWKTLRKRLRRRRDEAAQHAEEADEFVHSELVIGNVAIEMAMGDEDGTTTPLQEDEKRDDGKADGDIAMVVGVDDESTMPLQGDDASEDGQAAKQ